MVSLVWEAVLGLVLLTLTDVLAISDLPEYELENEQPNSCGKTVLVSEALVVSHQFRQFQPLYERDTDCHVTFRAATPGWKLRLVSISFDVPRPRLPRPCRDILLVYTSDRMEAEHLVTDAETTSRGFCGSDDERKGTVMHPITSTNPFLTLHFKTQDKGSRGSFELYLYEFADDDTLCYGQFDCSNEVVQCVHWNTTCNNMANCPEALDEMVLARSQCSLDPADRRRPPLRSTTTTTSTTTRTPSAESTPGSRTNISLVRPIVPQISTQTTTAESDLNGPESEQRDQSVDSVATAAIVGVSFILLLFTGTCFAYFWTRRKHSRRKSHLTASKPSGMGSSGLVQNPLIRNHKAKDNPYAFGDPPPVILEGAMYNSHYLPRPQPQYAMPPPHPYHTDSISAATCGRVSRSGRHSHPECNFYCPSVPPRDCENDWSPPTSGYVSRGPPMHTRPIPECPPPPPISVSSARSFSSCSYLTHKRNPTPVDL